MAATLQGKRIAFLAADGVEEVEYVQPREAVENAGATVELVSLKPGPIQSFNHLDQAQDVRRGRDRRPRRTPAAYDALVLPGGVANPDFLRADPDAVRFVRAFFDAGKPVGGDLPRPVDADRGGRGARSPDHLLAEPAYRPDQRRGHLGGRGGASPTATWSAAASPTTCRPSARRSSKRFATA